MGEPLDLASMLYRAGRPQQLIFYVAHLDDTQRMFFTTLLLEEMLAWTRRQPGSTNLRAILYFDEVFGYLPPHPANPPSKGPLLTLLKQARAFGVGVLLATQNPVDLDYKALSNAGTWFVGKLQTDRDKARLLEGMESAAAEHGTLTDRVKLDSIISALGNRIFLLHDIHRPEPLLFQSRWALSFLRGPMTARAGGPAHGAAQGPGRGAAGGHSAVRGLRGRPWAGGDGPLPQVRQISVGRASDAVAGQGVPPGSTARRLRPRPGGGGGGDRPHAAGAAGRREAIPPARRGSPAEGLRQLEMFPWVLGVANVVYVLDKHAGTEHTEAVHLLAQPPAAGHPTAWESCATLRRPRAGRRRAAGGCALGRRAGVDGHRTQA